VRALINDAAVAVVREHLYELRHRVPRRRLSEGRAGQLRPHRVLLLLRGPAEAAERQQVVNRADARFKSPVDAAVA